MGDAHVMTRVCDRRVCMGYVYVIGICLICVCSSPLCKYLCLSASHAYCAYLRIYVRICSVYTLIHMHKLPLSRYLHAHVCVCVYVMKVCLHIEECKHP